MFPLRLVGITLVAGLVAGCGGEEPTRAADRGAPVDVQVARVATTALTRPFEAGGTVRARTTATIVARIMAEVKAVQAVPGDRVRAGQTLVVLDSRDLDANRARAEAGTAAAEANATAATAALGAAEAGLELARSTHRRVSELSEKQAATPYELDQAVAGLRAAEAQAEAARANEAAARRARESAQAAADAARVMASYAVLTAPFDGVVTEKLIEPGNLASPGVPLMKVEDTRDFRLEASVDASRAAMVAVGETVEVVLGEDEPGGGAGRPSRVPGTVTEIARALDPGSHAFLIKVALPDETPARSGMYGRARFAGPAHEAVAVPAASLVRHGQLVSVFVVSSDGVAHMRLVNVAAASGDLVEVLAGVEVGETVVVNPPATLIDGAATSQRPAAAPAPGAAPEGGRR